MTLDGIDNGLLIFQAIAYVPSPRVAAGVRSELLFTILERLQAAQVPMAGASARARSGRHGAEPGAGRTERRRLPSPLPGTAID